MKKGDLLRFLLELQEECGGIIPFERYMQEALYHPDFGYYSAQIRDVGAAGDFSTSATLDPYLGQAIAAWIEHRAEKLGWRSIPVIEIGAGSGTLARSVLRHLSWKNRWRVNYRIHETSPVLRKRQKSNLRWRGVRWMTSLGETLKQSGGRALIFSNELVDAFPCRLFQKSGEGWQELGVWISSEGTLSEKILGSVPSDPWFEQFGPLPEGQRVERLDSYREWLKDWSPFWKEGSLLTIDYGDLNDRLYNRRAGGSLRAYYRHQRRTGRDLYARFGKQDLTADVNFTDLISWGTELGWKNASLITQAEFTTSWASKKSALSSLPTEAGDAFKVLEQTPHAP